MSSQSELDIKYAGESSVWRMWELHVDDPYSQRRLAVSHAQAQTRGIAGVSRFAVSRIETIDTPEAIGRVLTFIGTVGIKLPQSGGLTSGVFALLDMDERGTFSHLCVTTPQRKNGEAPELFPMRVHMLKDEIVVWDDCEPPLEFNGTATLELDVPEFIVASYTKFLETPASFT